MKKLFSKFRKENGRLTTKAIVLVVCITAIAVSVAGVTAAVLYSKPAPLKNNFTPSEVTTEIEETIEAGVKKNVKIKNTGNTAAYIRAKIVVTWQDDAGNVYGSAPIEGTDYSISYGTTNWAKATDGFYYYKVPVNPGASTATLINQVKPIVTSAKPNGNAPDGYGLCVDIISSAIQSTPASTVVSVWSSGVGSVSGTTLVLK